MKSWTEFVVRRRRDDFSPLGCWLYAKDRGLILSEKEAHMLAHMFENMMSDSTPILRKEDRHAPD